MIFGLVFQSCLKDTTEIDESSEAFGIGLKGHGQGRQQSKNIAAINDQIVIEWTELLLKLERSAGGMQPNASARALAYINLAV